MKKKYPNSTEYDLIIQNKIDKAKGRNTNIKNKPISNNNETHNNNSMFSVENNMHRSEKKEKNYLAKKYEFSNVELMINKINEITIKKPFSSHGLFGNSNFFIHYISDIHIEFHLTSNNIIDEIDNIIIHLMEDGNATMFLRQLRAPREGFLEQVMIFSGDIATTDKCVIPGFKDNVELFFSRLNEYINRYYKDKKTIFSRHCPIIFVMGNHELVGYNSADEAYQSYKDRLEKYGVTVLHNESLKFRNINIFGGVGFAKYNNTYNSDVLIGLNNFTREKEILESEKCEKAYNKILDESIKENKYLICISHYPTNDWLTNNVLSEFGAYVYGHTHKNYFVSNDREKVFADNQIGYTANEYIIKTTNLASAINPFANYIDGYHIITIQQYLDFYTFIGERINGIVKISKILENPENQLYVIKKIDYYGFFITTNAGTYMCVGGTPHKISENNNITYFEQGFIPVVYNSIAAIYPYRKLQEKICNELQYLGFSSKIHGCIVDIDFYNHIMINPYDGKISFYYSPAFGKILIYNSLEELLLSMGRNDLLENKDTYRRICLFSNEQMEIADSTSENSEVNNTLIKINIKNSIYSVSRIINQYQRLFDSNLLRVWDDEYAKKYILEIENDIIE